MSTKKILHVIPPLLLILVIAFFAAFTSVIYAQGPRKFAGGTPRYLALVAPHKQQVMASLAANKRGQIDTIPYWSDLFVYGMNPYPYQMVGTNPVAGSKQTTVATEIIPLKLVFSDGSSLDGTTNVKKVIHSPIFEKASFSSGFTQYGDAMQRAEFWKYVQHGSTNYHVILKSPKVYPTITLNVPATSGFSATASTGALVGLTDITYFDTQIQAFIASLKISPKTFPIFLTSNVVQYSNGDPANCCDLGYHSAIFTTTTSGQSQIQTYAWGSYLTPGLFGANVPIEDIHSLSHEIAEWYNDPFVDNITPTWFSPLAPQGCDSLLEVGDPLSGVAISIKTDGQLYHPQDEAFFSWFAKQKPSLGIKGQYSYLGTLTSPSPTC